MKPERKLNDGRYSYYLNGSKVISITRLFDALGIAPDFKFIEDYELKLAQIRGTVVHTALEQITKMPVSKAWGYDTSELPENTQGYVKSFLLWYRHSGAKIEEGSEELDACIQLPEDSGQWLAGRTDAIFNIRGKRVVVDYKTSKQQSKLHFLQAAAYKAMFKTDIAAILYLKADGKEAKLVLADTEHDKQLEKLLSLYYRGGDVKKEALSVVNNTTKIDELTAYRLASINKTLKNLETEKKLLLSELEKELSGKNAEYKDDVLSLHYTKSTAGTSTKVDTDGLIQHLLTEKSKKFTAMQVIDLIAEYTKTTVRKPSYRLTTKVKGSDNE